MKVGALILLVAVAHTVATPGSPKAVNWEEVLRDVFNIESAASESATNVVDLIIETDFGIAQTAIGILELAVEDARLVRNKIIAKIEARTWTTAEAERDFGVLEVILENARTSVLQAIQPLPPVLIEAVNQEFTSLLATSQEHKAHIITFQGN